jgi:hypothetical protein
LETLSRTEPISVPLGQIVEATDDGAGALLIDVPERAAPKWREA